MDISTYIASGELRAAVVVLILIWGLTEPLKRLYRALSDDHGQNPPRVMALGIGVFLAAWAWPMDTGIPWWQAGLALGTVAPAAHRLLLFFLERNWPGSGAALTGRKE